MSAETFDVDNALLKQFATAIVDILAVEGQMMMIWNEELSIMLPESPESDDRNIYEEAGGY